MQINNNPLVSICCTTYNHVSFVKECFDGFLMQKTNFDYEILVHDDASTDGTPDIIKEYELKYPHLFKVIYQSENQYSKGNKAVMTIFNYSRANGKYIAICEGDDYWTDPFKLQKQVDFLEENESFNLCGTYVQVLNKEGFSDVKKKIDYKIFDHYDILGGSNIPTLTICFRNGNHDFSKYYDYPFLCDTYLLLLLTKGGFLAAKLPYYTSVYRYHGAGVNSGNSSYYNIKHQLDVKINFIEKHFDDKSVVVYKKFLKIFLFNLMRYIYRGQNIKIFLHTLFVYLKFNYKYLNNRK